MAEFDARVIALLRAALDLDAAERAAFIERETQGDAALRARLDALLERDRCASLPMDAGLAGLDLEFADDADAHGDGVTRLGPWRLVEVLGHGGMGTVWLAERDDGAFTQRVALKRIRAGMASPHTEQQFLKERDLLARLKHPNIARIVDGGLDDAGRPWFAMELIEGVPLGTWLEQESRTARARLELFAKLCAGVAHAHQQLIVHRDLKPSNVLVTAAGEPLLLDFGIARLVDSDDGEATLAQQRFMTRDFAAPEQLRGEVVGTSADVYALGLILFELLTGVRYRRAQASDAEHTLRPSLAIGAGGQARAHAALGRAELRGDLDAIVMHALATDPARRYPSAEELGRDIRRHLDGRAIEARPDGAIYRLRKFIGRNRIATAMAALALVALVVGLGASLWQARVARESALRANAIKDYLIGLFDAGRTNAAGAQALDRPIIDMLGDSAARLSGELGDQPALRDEIYAILVEIHDSNGRGERAKALAAERTRQAEAAFGPMSTRLAPALLMQAGVALNHGDLVVVPGLLERAAAILDAADDRTSLARALLLQYRGTYTEAVDGDRDASLADLEAACRILRAHHAASDEFLVALFQLAQASVNAGRLPLALTTIAELRQRAVARHGEQHLYVTQADFLRARAFSAEGRNAEAVGLLRATRQRLEAFGGPGHNDVFVAAFFEIQTLAALGRNDEARALWRDADAKRRAHLPQSRELEAAFTSLGESLASPAPE